MPTDYEIIDFEINKQLGELYFLAADCGKFSVMKYRQNRNVLDNKNSIERDFGWFLSPEEAFRAAISIERIYNYVN